MNTMISKKSVRSKYKILTGIFLLLILSISCYYIYYSDTYLMLHSTNLQTGSEVEDCKTSSSVEFLCAPGYYQVTYPTHKRIFYYWFTSNIQLGGSAHKIFIEGADIKTFKALNGRYAIDKNNLYSIGYLRLGEIVKTPSMNLSSMSVFSDAEMYAKDNESVFFYGEKLPGASSEDFRFIHDEESMFGGRYALSNGKIFYGSKVVNAVRDGKILVKTQGKEIPFPCKNKRPGPNGNDLCDITESGEDERIEVDAGSFQVISNEKYSYVKDKNFVYMCVGIGCTKLHALDGADPDTFNFGEVRSSTSYENNNNHDGYVMGCKVYEGLTTDYRGDYEGVYRGGNDDSNLCKYVIY